METMLIVEEIKSMRRYTFISADFSYRTILQAQAEDLADQKLRKEVERSEKRRTLDQKEKEHQQQVIALENAQKLTDQQV